MTLEVGKRMRIAVLLALPLLPGLLMLVLLIVLGWTQR